MSPAGTLTTGVVSPNGADANLAVTLLKERGVAAQAFVSLLELAPVLDARIGCLILVEEALIAEEIPVLREALARQPAWCDLPLIIVARDVGAILGVTTSAFPTSGNVTLLERPLNPHTLVSAVQVALRASARQQEVGDLLAQRDRTVKQRDEFLAMLAHELRNPLAPIRNAVYMLQRAQLDHPLVLKSTEILERQVNHVVRLVDDLLDVARLERGKVSLKKQRVDVNKVVAAAAESRLQFAQDRGHHITTRLSGDALWVDADPVRLEQIVSNLVNNAAKFSPQPDEICIDTTAEGGFAVVRVEDQGIGFDPQGAQSLFDPFVQGHASLERSAGGLGMGLTIVKRLIELHSGSVHAESEGPGKGARFTVRIPLARVVAEPHAALQPLLAAARGRRVVVIEDDPDIRETLSMILRMWGHEVATASDGRAGIDLVLVSRPDVALVDIGLPTMSGYEVARAIRRDVHGAEMRLIAVTGYGQLADRERATQAGFDAHLLKPVVPETLERLLAQDDGSAP